MRPVYRLLGMVRRYGAGPVDTACGAALSLDVVSAAKIDSMLTKALEPAVPAVAAAGHPASRFSRDPANTAALPLSPSLSLATMMGPLFASVMGPPWCVFDHDRLPVVWTKLTRLLVGWRWR